MSDTYFVLMEPDDLVPWHNGIMPSTSENPELKVHKDDLSDFVFLRNKMEKSWKRVEKDQIEIQNRSRKLRLEFENESQALRVILCFQAIKGAFKNMTDCPVNFDWDPAQRRSYDGIFERLTEYLR